MDPVPHWPIREPEHQHLRRRSAAGCLSWPSRWADRSRYLAALASAAPGDPFSTQSPFGRGAVLAAVHHRRRSDRDVDAPSMDASLRGASLRLGVSRRCLELGRGRACPPAAADRLQHRACGRGSWSSLRELRASLRRLEFLSLPPSPARCGDPRTTPAEHRRVGTPEPASPPGPQPVSRSHGLPVPRRRPAFRTWLRRPSSTSRHCARAATTWPTQPRPAEATAECSNSAATPFSGRSLLTPTDPEAQASPTSSRQQLEPRLAPRPHRPPR